MLKCISFSIRWSMYRISIIPLYKYPPSPLLLVFRFFPFGKYCYALVVDTFSSPLF